MEAQNIKFHCEAIMVQFSALKCSLIFVLRIGFSAIDTWILCVRFKNQLSYHFLDLKLVLMAPRWRRQINWTLKHNSELIYKQNQNRKYIFYFVSVTPHKIWLVLILITQNTKVSTAFQNHNF